MTCIKCGRSGNRGFAGDVCKATTACEKRAAKASPEPAPTPSPASANGKAVVIQGDARNLPLPDAAVDLIVTSPPYFALRSYQDSGEHYDGQVGAEATPADYLDSLIDCTREWLRVLKPSGSIWVNLGDKYSGAQAQNVGRTNPLVDSSRMWAQTNPRNTGIPNKSLMGIPWRYALRCIDELGLILRAEVIWAKPNGLPESVTDRVRRSHEQWFHFTAQPRYFSAVDEVREPYAAATSKRYAAGYNERKVDDERPTVNTKLGGDTFDENPLGKLPGSVWTIPTEPLKVPAELGVDHFAAFPSEWPRRIIQGWSPADAVVLDPFGGTGTTALVASALGRVGISVDLSHDYCRLATWRTTDDKQLAKVERKIKAAAAPVAADPVCVDAYTPTFGEALAPVYTLDFGTAAAPVYDDEVELVATLPPWLAAS